MIGSAFEHAPVALAAYAAFELGFTGETAIGSARNRLALLDVGLTSSQIDAFVTRYPVIVTQYHHSSGLDVAVFRDVNGGLVVSFRGVTVPEDLNTAAGIAAAGAAYEQIVAMANWWQQVSSLPGKYVEQYSFRTYAHGEVPADAVVISEAGTLVFVLEHGEAVRASGELAEALAAEPTGTVDVTGHSLGGHLAMAFSALFESQTDNVSAFNAPGFKDNAVNQAFFAKLGGSFPASDSIVNVAADEALVDVDPFHLVAGLHSRPGSAVNVAIENQWAPGEPDPFGARNHSVAILVDSLAVYKLLAELCSSSAPLNEGSYKVILNQASQIGHGGYERIVDTLQAFFGIDRVPLAVGNPSREELYKAIYQLQANQSYQAWVGKVDIRPTPDNAAALLAGANHPTEGLAYRYAIAELSPFLMVAPTLYSSYEPGGDRHGLLNAYDPITNPFGITELYLQQRASLLERKLYITRGDLDRFYQDTITSSPGTFPNAPDARGNTYQLEARHYEDRESGFIASTGSNGNSLEHFIFGGNGPDDLLGADNPDHLYGGNGSDYLEGKGDADYLEGGRGLDLYAYRARTGTSPSSDGHDTFLDIDGKGVIRYTETQAPSRFSSTTVSTVIADASIKESDVRWRSADGRVVYDMQANAEGGIDLLISLAGVSDGGIRLRNFRDGDFGIHLWEARTDPQTSRTTLGSEDVDHLYGGRPTEQAPPDSPGDRIEAGAGNDVILSDRPEGDPDNGFGDADWIVAGEGRDDIDAGAGNDLVIAGPDGVLNGETGGDLVYGGAGDDALYADGKLPLDSAITQGNTTTSIAQKGDSLSGGAGDDWIVGGAARDALFGGGGRDLIVGGAGDDDIFGDAGSVATMFAWSITRDDGSATGRVQAVLNGFATADVSAGDADVIYAGRGVDWVFGGAGSDFIDGGADGDLIFGEAESDILIGADGNDYLVGDNPGVVPSSDEGDDYLDGGTGNDTLQADGGDDILVGGPGADILIGGAGKDIYVFRKGDGADVLIDDTSGPQASVLVRDDDFNDDLLKILPGSMILDFGGGDSIELASFDHTDPGAPDAFESLSFADGTRLTFADVLAIGFTVIGTQGSDDGIANPIILGTAFNDNVLALEGNDEVQAREGNDAVDGGSGNDRLYGGAGDDVLIGGFGHDVLSGDAGQDSLYGGLDNDWLWGGAGNDYLDGGGGIDQLFGGAGDDAYAFNPESHVLDPAGAVRVVFGSIGGSEISPGEISLTRQVVNAAPVYTVRYAGPGAAEPQQMFIRLSDEAQLEGFEFSDGTVLDHDDLLRETWVDQAHIVGTPSGDTLAGYAGDDLLQGGEGDDALSGHGGGDRIEGGDGSDNLYGGAGSDLLLGGAGADVLDGGQGDDQLEGGLGDDCYLIALNGGHDIITEGGGGDFDTVVFAGGRADATLLRLPSGDLSVAFDSGDTLTVSGQYMNQAFQVERLVFGDGVTIEIAEIDALSVPPIVGTSADDALVGTQYGDTLQGLEGNDFLDGGAGDDLLEGGSGVDTYRLRLAGGEDRATEDGAELSVIQLDPGIGFAHLGVAQVGIDLSISVPGTHSAILLTSYYAGQSAWMVRTHSGEQMPVPELIDYLARMEAPATVDDWRNRYVELARVNYLAYLNAFDATGDVFFHARGFSDEPLIRSSETFGETWSSATRTSNLHVGLFTAGTSDNVMDFRDTGLVVADAGAGDDLLTNLGWGVSLDPIGITWGSFLYGADGDDAIFGTWAADIIVGGAGADYMDGSQGDDIYVVFAEDSGTDIIDEVSGEWFREPDHRADQNGNRYSVDTLELVGIGHEQAILSIGLYDSSAFNASGIRNIFATLDIDYGAGVVRVLLPNPATMNLYMDPSDRAGIETIRFADGATLTLQQIFEQFVIPPLGAPGDERTLHGSGSANNLVPLDRELRTSIHGFGGNDYIEGGIEDDYLDGGEGQDIIHGSVGNDIIVGGAGDDMMLGGAGSDTYVYNLGEGVDRIFDPSGPGGSNTLRFGAGITEDDLSLGIGSLLVRIAGSDGAIHLESFDAQNPFGLRDVDRFTFADGTELSYEELIERGFDITGTQGADVLFGTAIVDRLRGGPGSDTVAGGGGSDVYFYDVGDGMDVVEEGADSASIDVLRFGGGITPGMIAVARRDDDIIVTFPSTGDEVLLSGWFIVPGGTIERVEFHDATFWTAAQLEGHIALPNQPPAIISPLEDQLAVEDAAFAYTMPGDAFADPDPADALIYSATLADGAPLPSWLTFDASTRTFAGTPVNENVGVLEVQVMANDGGSQSASDVFRLTVSNTNDAPMLAVPIADQLATAGASFHFVLAQESFIDADSGDSLTYSATLANGTALPDWLTFDPLERTFSGMPSRKDMGTLTIDVTATDQSDSSAVGTFDLTVAPSPSLGAQIKELTFQGSGNASGTISGLIQELLRQLAVGNHALFENQALNLLNAMASFAPPPGGEQTLLSDPSSALDPLIAATAQ